jgi:ABC-2 type transport system permease protein
MTYPLVLTLARTETRLLTREWAMMVFAFLFPPLTMLIIAGSFGDQPDEAFGSVLPDDFYVTGYFAIPIAAVGLIGLPVALASYRERDVLRRLQAFGVTTPTVVGAQMVVSLLLTALAGLLVVGAAAPTYGVPPVARPLETGIGFAAGAVTMLMLGAAIGLVVRTARGAQAIGLLLFFPMFLLSGGGPPPSVLGAGMRRLADVLPMTHAVGAIRDPWLDDGSSTPHLAALAAWCAVAAVAAVWAARRSSRDR